MRLTPGEVEQYQLLPGDILVNRVNSRELVGKAAICHGFPEATVFESKNIRLRLRADVVDPSYVNYLLLANNNRVQLSDTSKQTVGMATVSQPQLAALSFPFPPFAEQHRIVAKVKALLARVNAARQRLAKVPAVLKRFRQSVLAAACSGRLTADWREGQIKSNGYKTVRLRDVGTVTGGITKNATRLSFPKQVPYLRVANVYENRLELAEVLNIGVTADEFERTVLKRADLLFVEGNGSIDQIGRVALWDGSIPSCVHQNHLIRFRASERILPEYALIWMMAPQGREQLIEQAVSSAGLHSLSISKVAAVEMELTNLDEQREIVRRVEARFRLADGIEKRVAAATARVEKLTQAILAKAFRGELVPTEAELARKERRAFEPASVFLERIRAGSTNPGERDRPATRNTRRKVAD